MEVKRLGVATCVLLAVGALGCTGATPMLAPEIGTNPFPVPEQGPYRLQNGDVLAIKFWGNPELDEELPIRPDGYISLPFIDEVRAAGLTTVELDTELTSRYTGELKTPQITIIVRESRGQRVYVGGEVGESRAVEFNGPMTLLQAIQEAEYFLETARRKQVLVIRTPPTGPRLARLIDMRPIISGEDVTDDILLQPQDIIVVPRSKITSANQFMRQYFRDLLPIRFVLTYDPFTD